MISITLFTLKIAIFRWFSFVRDILKTVLGCMRHVKIIFCVRKFSWKHRG